MVNTPNIFVGESCEKRCVHGASNLDYGAANKLAESFLITYLLTQGDASHEYNLLAEDGDFENFTYSF